MPTPIVPPTPDNTPAPFSAEPALLAGQPDLPPDARPCPPGYTYTLVRRNADRTLAEYPADLFASKALQRALDRQTAPDVRVRHPSDAELLAPLIGRMRQEGRWLAKAKPGSETEFFTTRKLFGRYFFSRFAAHRTPPADEPPAEERKDPVRRPRISPDVPLGFHKALGRASAETTDVERSESRVNSHPGEKETRILAYLRDVLEDSGCSGWRGPATKKEQEDALIETAETYTLNPGDPVKGRFWPLKSPADIARLARKLQEPDRSRNDHGNPHGLVFAIADKVHTRSVQIRSGRRKYLIPVEVDVSRPGWRTTHGPDLFLATLARDASDGGEFRLIKNCVQPIYSRDRWIPVESDLEREVLWMTLNFCEAAAQSEVRFQLLKSFRPVGGIEGLLTDFVLQNSGSPDVHIEVLGSDATDYLSRKEREAMQIAALGLRYEAVRAYLFHHGKRAWDQERSRYADFLSNLITAGRV